MADRDRDRSRRRESPKQAAPFLILGVFLAFIVIAMVLVTVLVG